MRGIRQQLHWHDNPLYRFAASPDLARDPKLQRNVAHLADYGWTFDLQVFARQMTGAAELAAACPQGHLRAAARGHAGESIGQRVGGLATGHAEPRGTTQRGVQSSPLSAPSSIVTMPPISRHCFTRRSRFSAPSAASYGSNFPIEKLWTGYPALIGAFRDAARDLSDAAQRAIFADTSRRVYRLPEVR